MALPTLPLTRDTAPPPTSPSESPATARRVGWLSLPRIFVAVLLLGTAVLYLWGLSASGHANSFYSASVQAGSESWVPPYAGWTPSSGNTSPTATAWPSPITPAPTQPGP